VESMIASLSGEVCLLLKRELCLEELGVIPYLHDRLMQGLRQDPVHNEVGRL
jgi:hypothetical protein